MSNSTPAQVNLAYMELESAVEVFQAAILKFRNVYDPKTVGLDYWSEGLEDTMAEIDEDITEHFRE